MVIRALFILMISIARFSSASHSFAQSHPLPVKSEGVSTNTPLRGEFRFPITPAFRAETPHIKTPPPVAPSMPHTMSVRPGLLDLPSVPHIIHAPSVQRFVSPSFENRNPLTRIGNHQPQQSSPNHGKLEHLSPITTSMPWSKQQNPMGTFGKHDSPFSPIFTSSPFKKNLGRNFHEDHFFKRKFFANL